MSDRYGIHDKPQPPDWSGGEDFSHAQGRPQEFVRFDKALEALAHSGGSRDRQRAFEIIRGTLEDAGIPFTRANTLAERCYKALGEIL
jgi:hypothetical protein